MDVTCLPVQTELSLNSGMRDAQPVNREKDKLLNNIVLQFKKNLQIFDHFVWWSLLAFDVFVL